VASSLYFSFANQYSLGWGFPFPTVVVPTYKLSSCHTPIKSDLLGFPGIGVFACGLRDHEVRIIWHEYAWCWDDPHQLEIAKSRSLVLK